MRDIKSVLLVDDDPDDQLFFKEAMDQIGEDIVCLIANNGEDALNMLSDKAMLEPDYIFLDLNMPRINGWQFLSEIKKLEGLTHIPIVIFSTSGQARDKEESAKAGAVEFITKPYSFRELCDELAVVFSRLSQKYSTV